MIRKLIIEPKTDNTIALILVVSIDNLVSKLPGVFNLDRKILNQILNIS